MRSLALATALLATGTIALPAPAAAPERRCGWLQNPTPANYWLLDRDGEWTLSAQGGYRAEGMDDLPDMTTRGWVRTNGYYGYGCACMSVTTDRGSGRVMRIFSATPVPLRQCRADRRLPRL
jgi:hypothetical protein